MKLTPRDHATVQFRNVKRTPYSEYTDLPDMSAERVEVHGWRGLTKSTLSSRCFHVLEGEGTFIVAGKEYPVEPGNVVMVPKLTPYDYNGEMTLFIVHSPADHPDFNVNLE